MSADCPLCRSEGWDAHARIQVSHGGHSIVATLNVVTGELPGPHQANLSEAAWRMLGAAEGEDVTLAHPPPLDSLRHVRDKVYGRRLGAGAIDAIVRDVAARRHSAIELAAFVAACAGGRLDVDETIALTRATIDVGERLTWDRAPARTRGGAGDRHRGERRDTTRGARHRSGVEGARCARRPARRPAPVGRDLSAGEPLFTLHADSPGELAHALASAEANPDVIALGEAA